jgi:hypothetical protein
MSRCDELNVGILLMSLIKPVEIRVTVAPVSISKFVITPIQFNIQGQIGCYRVTVSETVVIPPQSEIVVNGKVNDRFPILPCRSVPFLYKDYP